MNLEGVRFVTFDCAGTLVRLKRPLVELLLESAADAGVRVATPEIGLFQAMYVARLPEFHRVNLLRDADEGRSFWVHLCADWLSRVGSDRSLAPAIQQRVDELAFDSPSAMFELYSDVLPCLHRLQSRGIEMAVISNWDYTLHRTIKMLEIDGYFKFVVASLEEGVEKPDPRLFRLVLAHLGADEAECLHVGDDPVDDVQGALGVGMRAALLDRTGATGDCIRSLEELW